MAKEKKTKVPADEIISLTAALSKRANYKRFEQWIVGDTPLITHAWSEKAKREMLGKQVKAVRGGREVRDPQEDFVNSLYEMGNGTYGFPTMGIKNCIVSAAHKDRGIARTTVIGALWLDAKMVRVRPALEAAVCDMPLTQIYADAPECREDMVKIGAGISKVANLAFRGQFTIWAMKIGGKYNSDMMTGEQLAFLLDQAGMAFGLGEWRNERKGMFGAFHLADEEETEEWEAYAAGKRAIPVPESYNIAAE